MSNFAALTRLCAVLAAAGIVLSGCSQSIAGTAVRVPGPLGPNVPPLQQSAMDRLLLSVGDVSSIVGGNNLQISNSSEDFADSSDLVDKPECLGAVFAAEKQVYNGSGWKAVRDQIIREPGDEKKHWVEQTVVLFPSNDRVVQFLDKSRDEWKSCEKTSVTTKGSNSTSYDWDFKGVIEPSETTISIDMDQQRSNNWICQHTMGIVSNLIVEGVVCGQGVGDESQQIVERIVSNASNQ
jgi:PknH-like extracellular domain